MTDSALTMREEDGMKTEIYRGIPAITFGAFVGTLICMWSKADRPMAFTELAKPFLIVLSSGVGYLFAVSIYNCLRKKRNSD